MLKLTKRSRIVLIILLGLLLVVGVLAFLCALSVRDVMYNSFYEAPDASYMTDFYADKKVLLIVPHEDDEYNVGSGILEQYFQNGSDVHIVWVTNGDAYGGGEKRINESILAMSRVGIPEDNLIFLGYGDSWDVGDYNHIYHMEDDAKAVSRCGKTQTYGTDKHPDYHTKKYGESAAYTRGNMKSDLMEQITDFWPDVIYAVDCDEHPDHRAVSLLSEEVIGDVLKAYPEYDPLVFKGFGYCTAWDGVRDYYADNVLSTKNPAGGDVMELRPQYSWADRVRLPVAASTLGATMRSSASYQVLQAFESQNALYNFFCIVNSDKVFWERETGSILYDARVSSSSGDASAVNDFRLSDTNNITREAVKWKMGVWTPDANDTEKTVSFSLDVPHDVSRIVLYDSPYEENHIINGVIEFSDGTQLETGELKDNGSPTEIEFDVKRGITDISFTIIDSVGDEAGIMEMEAYEPDEKGAHVDILKLVVDDNFAYEYSAKAGTAVSVGFSSFPEIGSGDSVKILVDGKETCQLGTGETTEYVPDGRVHQIKAVLSSDESVYDEITLRTLGACDRLKIRLARYFEQLKQ